ncbi:hypothetical protein [Nannocystis radixulma]|uniref:Uncharacterized protein n=1 Tax=Nannocystis radixulma TaxID=2995305 RepID=A0ABT5BEZ0_9BACT|nr:hypothetical protein [Nannocystis radixulma]MDC0672642.1 hypothetical protein [Nannocystis radixulma]
METSGATADGWGPNAAYVLCPFELSQVVCTPRTPEVRFTGDELEFLPAMVWTGDALIVGLRRDSAPNGERWAVGKTVDATAELSVLWELPTKTYPDALLAAGGELFVVAGSRSSEYTGGLFRLHPDGSHERLLETPYSGLRYTRTHPLVLAGGMIYGRMTDTALGWEGRPTRIPPGGGELEVFDFVTQFYGLVDGAFIGFERNLGPPPCDHGADCTPPLLSLALRRYDLATGAVSEIQPKICITGNPGYRPSSSLIRPVDGVGVHDGGLVIDDGALVDIGFDGSHRVIAAVADGIDDATLHAGAIYFVSGQTFPAEVEYRALRRVSLQGGVVEELARFDGPGNLEIGAFDGEHVFVGHQGSDGLALLRIAL